MSPHSLADEVETHLPDDHWPLPELTVVADDHSADGVDFVAAQASDDYRDLRRSFTTFAFPMTAVFVGLYFVFVVMAVYLPSLMATKVFGFVNVGILFGLANFATTYLVTALYVRHANRNLDPRSAALRTRLEDQEL